MNTKLPATTLIAFFFTIFSCKKDNDPNDRAHGDWAVYRTPEYNLKVAKTTRQEIEGFKVLTATSTEISSTPKSINIWFKEWPVASGNYQSVEFLSNRNLGNNQVGISITFPGKDTLYSTGLKFVGISPDPAPELMITSTNGKLTVDIPMMSAYTNTGRYIDSALFRGIITEK